MTDTAQPTPEQRAEWCVALHADKGANNSILMPADILERIASAIREAGEDARLEQQEQTKSILIELMCMVEQHCAYIQRDKPTEYVAHGSLSTNESAFAMLHSMGLLEHVKGDRYELVWDNLDAAVRSKDR